MKDQFEKFGINNNDVTWMSYPNREDLTQELIDKIYDRNRLSYTDNDLYHSSYANPYHSTMPTGAISCTYKHYLAICDIVEKNLDYAVIMEDNIQINFNVNNALDVYLKELPEDWDLMFEGDICDYRSNMINGINIYKQNITRGLNFYLISKNGAKKLKEKILPFSLNLDNLINIMIYEKEIDLNLYWGELDLIHKIDRPSTWR
jgi:GR25 family glycosyltransferase involved in LPS biosynthesis